MPWFRVDDSFYDHPKVRRAGNTAIGLWIRCAAYAARHTTDGDIPVEIARDYGTRKDIVALITAGLWIDNGDVYMMKDYLDYNPSAAQLRAKRAETIEIHRAGGRARARNAVRDEHGQFVSKDDL